MVGPEGKLQMTNAGSKELALFLTCGHRGASALDRGEIWDAALAPVRKAIGRGPDSPLPRTEFNRYLHPRGYVRSHDVVNIEDKAWECIPIEQDEQSEVALFHRLRSAAAPPFPTLHEAILCFKRIGDDAWRAISERIPCEDVSRVVLELSASLKSDVALFHGAEIGLAARLFSLAASPRCLAQLIDAPAPSERQVDECLQRMLYAAQEFEETFALIDGSDACRYIVSWVTSEEFIQRLREDLRDFSSSVFHVYNGLRPVEKRVRGRPSATGRTTNIVRALADVWTRCEMGKASGSPQSRFVAVCTTLLPLHGVFKADVPQFVKQELARKRNGGVLIG